MSDESWRAYLELADWRRRVAALWETWRVAARIDPAAATEAFRASRDTLFRDHPQSPLPEDQRAAFGGLAYWPYDPAWRMTVRLEPADDAGGPHDPDAGQGPLSLPASGPGAFAFRRIGWVDLAGPLVGQRLEVYWLEGYGGGIFLPFRDATSGEATYGAGRYLLDTAKAADHGSDATTGQLVLDFNLAYHPSCAYDPRWSCPLAPPGNRLALPVTAGERLRMSPAVGSLHA